MITIGNKDPLGDITRLLNDGKFDSKIIKLSDNNKSDQKLYYNIVSEDLSLTEEVGITIFLGGLISRQKYELEYMIKTKYDIAYTLLAKDLNNNLLSDDTISMLDYSELISKDEVSFLRNKFNSFDFSQKMKIINQLIDRTSITMHQCSNHAVFENKDDVNKFIKRKGISNYKLTNCDTDKDLIKKYKKMIYKQISELNDVIIKNNNKKIFRKVMSGKLSYNYLSTKEFMVYSFNVDEKASKESFKDCLTDIGSVEEYSNVILEFLKSDGNITENMFTAISILNKRKQNSFITDVMTDPLLNKFTAVKFMKNEFPKTVISSNNSLVNKFKVFFNSILNQEQSNIELIQVFKENYSDILITMDIELRDDYFHSSDLLHLNGFNSITFTTDFCNLFDHLSFKYQAAVKEIKFTKLILDESIIVNFKEQRKAYKKLLNTYLPNQFKEQPKAIVLLIDKILEAAN